jgi:hypothetical protein
MMNLIKAVSMKKRLLIYIPTLLVIVVMVTLLLLTNRQPPQWKTKLDQYLNYLQTTGYPSYQLISAVPASQPPNFTPAMSAESFSDSVIFQTDLNIIDQTSAGTQPIPYPSDAVWCVLLKNGGQQRLIYIALHNSLYNADWIVHTSADPWGSSELQNSLDRLGCIFQ